MRIFLPIIYLIAFLDLSLEASSKVSDPALESKVKGWMKSTGGLRFTENKGQMTDLQGNAVSSLLFKASAGGTDMYITTSGLSYVFTKTEKQVMPQLSSSTTLRGRNMHGENESTTMQYCRADMELVGADIRKENIIKENESEDRTDYYLAHCSDGVLNVHSYEKITVKNIYPGIDWVLYRKNQDSQLRIKDLGIGREDFKNTGELKYDFIVHPGADPSLIRLRYKWADKPILQRDGSVKISTPMGDILEGTPVSFGREKEQKINTRYSLKGDEIKFVFGNYNKENTLTIDPSLVWATYYDGMNNLEETRSMDLRGTSIWITGDVWSVGFPMLNPQGGAYFQGTFGGGTSDAMILQFSTCGQLIWATYYGGSSDEQGNSISSDGVNVWVTGFTTSSDFPTKFSVGTFQQPALKGAQNAFILQFSCSNDNLVWASYYGGSGTDYSNSINSDGTNVWVTGRTSSTNLPLQIFGGAYNQAPIGGIFILRFNCSNSSLLWATYYGTSNTYEGGNAINSDGTNVWVTGFTFSAGFPLQNLPGAYNQSTLGGIAGNAFILQFSCTTSARIWATYFGGSGSAWDGDQGTSIFSDGVNVWVTGNTSSSDFPIKTFPGAYNQSVYNGGASGSNAFILQFACSGSSLIWATCLWRKWRKLWHW